MKIGGISIALRLAAIFSTPVITALTTERLHSSFYQKLLSAGDDDEKSYDAPEFFPSSFGERWGVSAAFPIA